MKTGYCLCCVAAVLAVVFAVDLTAAEQSQAVESSVSLNKRGAIYEQSQSEAEVAAATKRSSSSSLNYDSGYGYPSWFGYGGGGYGNEGYGGLQYSQKRKRYANFVADGGFGGISYPGEMGYPSVIGYPGRIRYPSSSMSGSSRSSDAAALAYENSMSGSINGGGSIFGYPGGSAQFSSQSAGAAAAGNSNSQNFHINQGGGYYPNYPTVRSVVPIGVPVPEPYPVPVYPPQPDVFRRSRCGYFRQCRPVYGPYYQNSYLH